MKKATIVSVERTADGRYKVTYSTGTVRKYYKTPNAVWDWWLEQNIYPKRREEHRKQEAERMKMEANPTNVKSCERTADGRYRVTYQRGTVKTYRAETLPNTVKAYMAFDEEWNKRH